MKNRICRIVICLCLLSLIAPLCVGRSGGDPCTPGTEFIRVDSASLEQLEITIHPRKPREIIRHSEGRTWYGYAGSIESSDPIPGRPMIPRLTIRIAVPPQGDINFNVIRSLKNEHSADGILLWEKSDPSAQENAAPGIDNAHVASNFQDPVIPDAPSIDAIPREPVVLSSYSWFRGNRIAILDVFPVIFDPDRRIITRYDALTIGVDFPSCEDGTPAELRTDSEEMIAVARNLVINPDALDAFRTRDRNAAEKPAETETNHAPGGEFPGSRALEQSAGSHSGAPADSLPSGSGWRFEITSDGICRITDEIDFTGVDPRHVGVWYLGEELPVYVHGEDDGAFDPGDYIEFPCSRYRNPDGSDNKYTGTGVYWVVTLDRPGQRIPVLDGSQPGGVPAAAFPYTLHREDNGIFAYGDYYWQSLHVRQAKQVNVPADRFSPTMDPCNLRILLKGVTSLQDINPDHHILVRWNGNPAADRYWDGTAELLIEVSIPASTVIPGDNTLEFLMPGDTAAGDVDGAFLDWIELDYSSVYTVHEDAIAFTGPVGSPGGLIRFDLNGFTEPVPGVYRLNPSQCITGVSVFPSESGLTCRFTDTPGENTRYAACSRAGCQVPQNVTYWTDAGLGSPDNRADYLVITHADFKAELEPFRRHLESRGMDVLIAGIDDIFNTFSDGIWDPEAVKDFCRTAFFDYSGNPPSHVLLVGDSSWDYKQFLPGSRDVNFLPAYGKIWTESSLDPYDRGPYDSTDLIYGEPMVDDQFVCVSGTDNLPDMTIGRLPVQNAEQLRRVIEQIITYSEQSRDRSWQKNILFINGGVGDSEQDMFSGQSETMISELINGSGQYWRISRIYKETDHREWGWYEDDILGKINSGQLLVNFFGHAGTWSWEAMLNFDDLAGIDNAGHLPVITSMTCNTARFANPFIDSFGEQCLLGQTASGGIAAFWGGCNFGGYWSDYYMAYFFYANAVRSRINPIGSVILMTKLLTLTRYPGYAIIIEPYSLLGDPALEIALPSAPVVHLAGYMATSVSAAEGGLLTVSAFVTHPDGLSRMAGVELFFNGQPTGVMLMDDGAHGDMNAGDGFYALEYPIPPAAIDPVSLLLEIVATDIDGNRSRSCPVLRVDE